MLIVLVLLAGALALFVTERLPVELVSLLVLGLLLLVAAVGPATGWVDAAKWITLPEALSGFSNPAVVTVAAMLVLSAGLEKTGALATVGQVFIRLGRHQTVLLTVMMLVVGVVSAFINNTATVAVFLPLVLLVCARHNLPPSRVLIPLSFASQFGGVCTLIGTSTNLLVSSISEKAGAGAFRLFEMSPLGVILLGVGGVYLLLASRWLLPDRRGVQLTETYQLREYLTEVRVLRDSPLIGKTVMESQLGERHDVTVLEILRGDRRIWTPEDAQLQAGDILLVRGKVANLMELRARTGLEIESEFKLKDETLANQELVLVEALVSPRSRLANRTLAEADFRWRYDAIVLALQRHGQVLREKLAGVRLEFGDALLLLLRRADLHRLRANDDIVVLSEVETPALRTGRALTALLIIGGAVALAALNVMPILVSAILGALGMVLARCLTLAQAYRAIDWKVVFLLAGVLPLGLALEKSGAARFFADHLLGWIGQFGPLVVLAALYFITAVLTEVMSNNAAAVLLAPIAISTATHLGVDPKPLLMAVTFAASTSFATPVGYQTNTMVYGAGGYRFTDFLKVGLPLNLIFWALAVWFIPRFWPF
jgi:di/tricarboxylate transporter